MFSRQMGEEVKGAAAAVVPESVLKKRKRAEEWALAKKQALESAKKTNSDNRKLIYIRAKKYAQEYDEQVCTIMHCSISVAILALGSWLF